MPVYIGKKWRFGQVSPMPDRQTTEDRATQLLYSIQLKLSHAIRALPSDDLFFLACPFSWQAAKCWRAWLLPQFLHPWLSSDGKCGEFIALIWSKMLPSVGVLAYFSSMKTLSWSWKLLSSLLFAFNHSSKSSRIASSTASMLRPGEQIVTEGKLSSDTGLAGSWVV